MKYDIRNQFKEIMVCWLYSRYLPASCDHRTYKAEIQSALRVQHINENQKAECLMTQLYLGIKVKNIY